MSQEDRDLDVKIGDVTCRRCGGQGWLATHVPHHMALPGGGVATGRWRIVLCPRCDRDDPAAAGLLAFFAVHDSVTADTVEQAGALIHEWRTRRAENPPTYTDAELDDDIRRWEQGEM